MPSYVFEKALLADGWCADVCITVSMQGLIESIQKNAASDAGTFIPGVALPGMPNLHSHAFQRMMAGLTEYRAQQQDSFWTWRDLMYQYANSLEPEDVRIAYAFVYMEMLKAGYTSVAEFHYLHHAMDGQSYEDPAEMSLAVLDAAKTAGIALTHLPVLYMTAGLDMESLKKEQQRFYHSIDSYVHLLESLTVSNNINTQLGIAFHSLRAVPVSAIKEVLEYRQLKKLFSPVHIHIAEQQAEVESCLQYLKQRPVDWLLANVEVNQDWCLVHATHINKTESQSIAASGAVVGLCPVTEANLGDGIFPLPAFMQSGGRYGIGSDSNVSINPREELRLLEYSQRLMHQQRNIAAQTAGEHTGTRLYQEALLGGSQACGIKSGSLSLGLRADIIVFDGQQISNAGFAEEFLMDQLIFNSTVPAPTHVFVNGRLTIEHGRHQNEESITKSYLQLIRKIRQQ